MIHLALCSTSEIAKHSYHSFILLGVTVNLQFPRFEVIDESFEWRTSLDLIRGKYAIILSNILAATLSAALACRSNQLKISRFINFHLALETRLLFKLFSCATFSHDEKKQL